MHIIIFRKIFAQRTCHTAPCLLCQRRYCVAVCAMLPDVEIHEISLHEGDECTCDSDLACQTLKLTMMSCRNGWWSTLIQQLVLYWIDPVDAADRLAAKLEPAETFYFDFERQESEQRPAKRAFGRANSGSVFQEAQLIDMNSVHFIHLSYVDKSFSRQHRGHYPIYCTWTSKYAKYPQYTFVCSGYEICRYTAHMYIWTAQYNFFLYRKPFEYFTESLLNILFYRKPLELEMRYRNVVARITGRDGLMYMCNMHTYAYICIYM